MHCSPSRLQRSRPDCEVALQPRRRQPMLGGIGSDESSDSDSGDTDGKAE